MDSNVLLVIILAITVPGSFATTFTFKNNCPYTVWPATLTGAGKSQFPSSGFELGTGASKSLDAPAGWSGRFWARTGCTNKGKFICSTADCGSGKLECSGAGGAPPATLVEFTLQGSGGLDFYDVSLVDGFNLPVSLTPHGGSSCKSTTCSANVNALCPPELSVKGSSGSTISCKSACFAFNQPQYCCSGAYQSPDKCQPSNYSRIFKKACPQAYSYAFDDKTSTFTCSQGANYLIAFCP